MEVISEIQHVALDFNLRYNIVNKVELLRFSRPGLYVVEIRYYSAGKHQRSDFHVRVTSKGEV